MDKQHNNNEPTRVTFRKRGKAHRGLIITTHNGRNHLAAACSCPGSRNGRLTNGAQIVCQGWDRANCQN
jgi:hypothetical protein